MGEYRAQCMVDCDVRGNEVPGVEAIYFSRRVLENIDAGELGIEHQSIVLDV